MHALLGHRRKVTAYRGRLKAEVKTRPANHCRIFEEILGKEIVNKGRLQSGNFKNRMQELSQFTISGTISVIANSLLL